MASFNTVRLACFDGKSAAFKKYNANSGYKPVGTRPNKVSIPSIVFVFHFGFFICFACLCHVILPNFKNHDRAKDFWMHQLDTCFSYYKLDTLDHFRSFLGVRAFKLTCYTDIPKNCLLALVQRRF